MAESDDTIKTFDTVDGRLQVLLDVIGRLAAGDYGARGEPSGRGDEFDAVLVGINMLGEELEAAVAGLQQEKDSLERRVQERTGLLRSVLDNMSEGVIVADAQGRFQLFNESAVRLLGTGISDVSPDQWSQVYRVYHPGTDVLFPAADLPLAGALKGEASDGVELQIDNPTVQEPVLISVSGRPLRNREA